MLEMIIPAGLGLIAAAGLYLTLINRILSQLSLPKHKLIALFWLMIGLCAIFAGLGLFGGKVGLGIILLILAGLAAGDVYYRINSRRLRGSPPVQRTGPTRSLLRPNTTLDLNVLHYRVEPDYYNSSNPKDAGSLNDRPQRVDERSLRIAHLSDLHLNHRLPPSYYQAVADQISLSDPDLVFITGDFVTEAEGIHRFPEIAEQLAGRCGTFAIFGNHDYWAGHRVVSKVVQSTGICLLGNGWQRVDALGRKIVVLGCEQPWNQSKLNIPELQADEMLLVLSHTADHIYRLSALGAQAVFSGHYHAGQFQIPGFGPVLIPSKYGRKFHHGHYRVNGTHLFVTAGVGASHPALRVYCPPDIMIVDIQ